MKMNYPKIAEHLGVKLRGNETFDELLKIEQQVKEHNVVRSKMGIVGNVFSNGYGVSNH
jgi:hypothetical protein